MRKGEGNGCRVVTDREGIRPDNGGGDGSKVVREEGPGRGAAVTVRGGVVSRRPLRGLGAVRVVGGEARVRMTRGCHRLRGLIFHLFSQCPSFQEK